MAGTYFLLYVLFCDRFKDTSLKEIFDVFEFAWGDASQYDATTVLAAVSSSSTTGMLAIEDGEVGNEDDDEEDDEEDDETDGCNNDGYEPSIATTEPEQTPDEVEPEVAEIFGADDHMGLSSVPVVPEIDANGTEIPPVDANGKICGMDPEVYRMWALKNPQAAQKNMDGTQPEPSPSEAPSPSSETPASSRPMGPPAPLSPGTIQRKRERLAELRWASKL